MGKINRKKNEYIENYKDFWVRYAKYNGNSTVSQFWTPIIFNFLIQFSIFGFFFAASVVNILMNHGKTIDTIVIFGFLLITLLVFNIAVIIPTICVTKRRINDSYYDNKYFYILFLIAIITQFITFSGQLNNLIFTSNLIINAILAFMISSPNKELKAQ